MEVQLRLLGTLLSRSIVLVQLLQYIGNLLILGFDEVSLNTKFRYQLFLITLKLISGFLQCSSVFLFFFEVLLSIMKSPFESFSKFFYIESREIYGVTVSHFWHIGIFYPLLMISRVGSSREII
jgi:hypothetical protein